MERGDKSDERAEFALSSMVTMIMILMFSSIIAGMLVMIIEQAFMGSRTQSIEQSESLNSMVQVLAFEIETYDTLGNTNDQIYIAFKFPYASSSIPDTSVKWAIMCDDGNVGGNPSNNMLDFSTGDFDFATLLTGTGLNQNAITQFTPGTYYHIILSMTSPGGNGDCDLRDNYGGTFVIAVENGRTTEIDFYVPRGATSGYDLMS